MAATLVAAIRSVSSQAWNSSSQLNSILFIFQFKLATAGRCGATIVPSVSGMEEARVANHLTYRTVSMHDWAAVAVSCTLSPLVSCTFVKERLSFSYQTLAIESLEPPA